MRTVPRLIHAKPIEQLPFAEERQEFDTPAQQWLTGVIPYGFIRKRLEGVMMIVHRQPDLLQLVRRLRALCPDWRKSVQGTHAEQRAATTQGADRGESKRCRDRPHAQQ